MIAKYQIWQWDVYTQPREKFCVDERAHKMSLARSSGSHDPVGQAVQQEQVGLFKVSLDVYVEVGERRKGMGKLSPMRTQSTIAQNAMKPPPIYPGSGS